MTSQMPRGADQVVGRLRTLGAPSGETRSDPPESDDASEQARRSGDRRRSQQPDSRRVPGEEPDSEIDRIVETAADSIRAP
jgi:hypothetical protein